MKFYQHAHHDDDCSQSEWSDYSDIDSDSDPSYRILEDAQNQLSNLSIRKKSNSRIDNDLDKERNPEEEELKIIESGKLEKLKVEQCKLYLRKHGLRLTGNKDTLIQRITEHQQILNDGGEKKYPVSSFVLNCKGDACMGDVVMFEQNVYEKYSIASRSASGPPCGTRMVAGRIVKESYGAAKQQHTFTVEVLWSKGEKPLPPLHPLLIKGRNLYRLKTMRQRWEDEEERRRVLLEKHLRGSLARDAREERVQKKEMRKVLGGNRALKKEKRNKNQLNSNSAAELRIAAQRPGGSGNRAKMHNRPQQLAVKSQRTGSSVDMVKLVCGSEHLAAKHNQPLTSTDIYHRLPLTSLNSHHSTSFRDRRYNQQQQLCKFYAQGRCKFGDNCKFLHDL